MSNHKLAEVLLNKAFTHVNIPTANGDTRGAEIVMDVSAPQAAAAELRADRYARAIDHLSACPLQGEELADYVQELCESLIDGEEAPCWNCGTPVHPGLCAGEFNVAEEILSGRLDLVELASETIQ